MSLDFKLVIDCSAFKGADKHKVGPLLLLAPRSCARDQQTLLGKSDGSHHGEDYLHSETDKFLGEEVISLAAN